MTSSFPSYQLLRVNHLLESLAGSCLAPNARAHVYIGLVDTNNELLPLQTLVYASKISLYASYICSTGRIMLISKCLNSLKQQRFNLLMAEHTSSLACMVHHFFLTEQFAFFPGAELVYPS